MQTLCDLQRKFFRNADCKRIPEQDRILLEVPKDSPLNKLLAESGHYKLVSPPDPGDWKNKIKTFEGETIFPIQEMLDSLKPEPPPDEDEE